MSKPAQLTKKKKKSSNGTASAPKAAMMYKMNKRAQLPHILPEDRTSSLAPEKAWLKQLNSVFERHVAPVHMPLYDNNYPCPSTLVTNVAAHSLTMVNGFLHVYPMVNGTFNTSDDCYTSAAAAFANGTAKIGGNLSSASYGPVAFAYADAVAENTFYTWPAAVSQTKVEMSPLSTPFTTGLAASPNASGLSFRTVAYGIRVSFSGSLQSTEGWVEWYQPYEPQAQAASIAVTTLRRDPSYRRKYFSSQRTHEFFWEPTCDDVKFCRDYGETALISNITTRQYLLCGGLAAGDKLDIEVVSIQEWVGYKAVPVQEPRYATPKQAQLANTVLATYGTLNDHEDRSGLDKFQVFNALIQGGQKAYTFASRLAAQPAVKAAVSKLLSFA